MLFVGDDWAEEHHDIEIVDETGRVLARKRLPEGLVGMTRLHELLGNRRDLPTTPSPADNTVTCPPPDPKNVR